MTTHQFRLLECPCCGHRGAIDITPDLSHPALIADTGDPAGQLNLKAGRISSGMKYRGVTISGSVCHHLLSTYAEIEIRRGADDGPCLSSRMISFDHPWFAEHDPEHFLGEELYGSLEEPGVFKDSLLSNRWAKRSLYHDHRIPGTDLVLVISGTAHFAVNPTAFLQEFDGIVAAVRNA